MCGRYVTPDTTTIQAWWKSPLISSGQFPCHYNAAPSLQVPVIHAIPERGNELCLARWGFIPHWWKESALPSFSFNARSEEAQTKPMWREAYQSSRCIMPASGWYEWQAREVVDEKTGKAKQVKQPYFLYDESQPVIGIAGLLSVWFSPDNGPMMTCALMTKTASPGLMEVHDRMPVILNRETCEQWLKPELTKADVAQLVGDSETVFSYHPVSKAVNNARNNGEALLERL
jgi:putative SOS response-associated peptidase YedK